MNTDGYQQQVGVHVAELGSGLKPEDQMREDLVLQLSAQALQLQSELRDFTLSALASVDAFVEHSAREYGRMRGGRKGNVRLSSHDGQFAVVVQQCRYVRFDERLMIAKDLIDQLLMEWTESAPKELRSVVMEAFALEQSGQVVTYKILRLKRLNISHPKWLAAMQAIDDALMVSVGKRLLRFYKKDHAGSYKQIALSSSKLG